jgi:hypothetical protein
MTEPAEILGLLDTLTLPIRTKVIQGADGDDTRVATVEQEPLLVQLEAAIRGEMTQTAGASASLKSTRGLIDSDALYQFVRINNQINEWSRLADAPRRADPASQLRAWYAAYTATNPDEGAVNYHLRTMRGWVATIVDKLDPTDEKTLPDSCPNPECPQGVDKHTGRPTWWDAKSREERTDPLVIRFRRSDGPDMVLNARGRCRACGTQWTARALAWELEIAAQEITRV